MRGFSGGKTVGKIGAAECREAGLQPAVAGIAVSDIAISDIKAALEKVLRSDIFRNAPRLHRFLSFVVRRTVECGGEGLKEFVVGTEVFGRGRSFDPRLDSIVRVEAGRLRTRLDRYYASEGQNDAIQIELPKGGYVPLFRAGKAAPPASSRRGRSLTIVPFVRSDSNAAAYDLYLRGTYFEGRRSVESFAKGLDHLQRAARLNPSFAPAWARLASSHLLRGVYGLESPHTAMTEARKAAEKALLMDGALAQAHSVMACIRAIYDWDWPAAGQGFRRALDLNAGAPEIHHAYAFFYLSPLGRHEEAIRHIRRGRDLDPLSLVLNAAECAVLFWCGDYDGAIHQGRKTVELEPNYYPGHMYLSWAWRMKGLSAKAIAAAEEAVRISPTPPALCSLGLAYAAGGKMELASGVIARFRSLPYSPPASVAYIYGEMGEADAAFEALDEARQQRSPTLIYLKTGQWNRAMRADARFSEALRAVGFAPACKSAGL